MLLLIPGLTVNNYDTIVIDWLGIHQNENDGKESVLHLIIFLVPLAIISLMTTFFFLKAIE